MPEQPPPLQPPKVDGDVGEAVSVTIVLLAKAYEQVEPQLIPAGELVTVPLPVPLLLTVSAGMGSTWNWSEPPASAPTSEVGFGVMELAFPTESPEEPFSPGLGRLRMEVSIANEVMEPFHSAISMK